MTVVADRRPAFVRATHAFGRVLLRLGARVRLEGLDRPDIPARGPLIITSNHLSNADPVVIGACLGPAVDRQFHWLAKEESLRTPVIGWGMRQNGVIGVRRGAGDIEAFKLAKRVLDEGLVLFVFPEGTRSRTGALQEAKDGVAMLALRSGATILPIAVEGTEVLWPRGAGPRFGSPVTLRVGAPYRLPSYDGLDRKAAHAAATTEIMARIAALLPPAYRGVYAEAADTVVSAPPVT